MAEGNDSPNTADWNIGLLRDLGYDARPDFYGMPKDAPEWEITEWGIIDKRIKGKPLVAKYKFVFDEKDKRIKIHKMELNEVFKGTDTYYKLEKFCSDNDISCDTFLIDINLYL